MRMHGCSFVCDLPCVQVTYSYTVGLIYILLGMLTTESLAPGFWYCWEVNCNNSKFCV